MLLVVAVDPAAQVELWAAIVTTTIGMTGSFLAMDAFEHATALVVTKLAIDLVAIRASLIAIVMATTSNDSANSTLGDMMLTNSETTKFTRLHTGSPARLTVAVIHMYIVTTGTTVRVSVVTRKALDFATSDAFISQSTTVSKIIAIVIRLLLHTKFLETNFTAKGFGIVTDLQTTVATLSVLGGGWNKEVILTVGAFPFVSNDGSEGRMRIGHVQDRVDVTSRRYSFDNDTK